ncbi:MAG: hypothetical protein GKR90_06120 [Pseudomonadales bacterium]|nr:hypothetical protein [Pseudomonadales bacterium]
MGRTRKYTGFLINAGAAIISLLPNVASADLSYVLQVADDLRTIDIRLHVDAERVIPVGDVRLDRLKGFRHCDGSEFPKREVRRGIPKGATCVEYEYRIPRTPEGRFRIDLPSGVATANPAEFLFLHPREAASVKLEGRVPVSHPWPVTGDKLVIPRSPRSSTPQIVLGAFHRLTIEGLKKPAAYIGPKENAAKIQSWLNELLWGVAGGAQFPNPNAQIMVFAVPPRGESPVPFGHVIRNQGESVRLFVDADRSIDDLRYDWTVAHELSHLKLPYVSGSGRWVSEGFASYYQNVIQARLGHYSEQEAWQRMTRSFGRADEVGRDMTPNSATRESFWKSRLMIYWSGAAFALLADIELRSHGLSLDEALRRLTLPNPRSVTPLKLFEMLDDEISVPIFVPLYENHADSLGMPDTNQAFYNLGIETSTGTVRLVDDRKFSHIRKKIMAPSQATLAQ